MQEKQLINKLQELQQIKPRKDWAILVKNQILEPKFSAQTPAIQQAQKEQSLGLLRILPALIYQRKLAYAFATLSFIMIGMFGFAQYTMPGDALFSVRKMTEKSQAFMSQENQLKNNFEVANKRLSDLAQVVKDNKVQNIAPAIREFQASISEATKNLTGNAEQRDPQSIKEIAVQVKKIEDSKKELQTYGVDLGATQESKDLNDALAPLVQREIDDLEKTTLTEDQQKTMQEAKDLYADGKYTDALEKILTINN
ncbi:MAG: hypothetical protein HY219_01215 [Candidatus Staskawiczbacteria bacterium]|nr:hypothetical protein [Candidatus Staskawiczbacteria bacterium]